MEMTNPVFIIASPHRRRFQRSLKCIISTAKSAIQLWSIFMCRSVRGHQYLFYKGSEPQFRWIAIDLKWRFSWKQDNFLGETDDCKKTFNATASFVFCNNRITVTWWYGDNVSLYLVVITHCSNFTMTVLQCVQLSSKMVWYLLSLHLLFLIEFTSNNWIWPGVLGPLITSSFI